LSQLNIPEVKKSADDTATRILDAADVGCFTAGNDKSLSLIG